MTYKAKVQLRFDSEWTNTSQYGGFDVDQMLPEEHILVEAPAEDLTTPQLFKMFSDFLRAMGHDEVNIMKGGCSIAFNEMYSTAVMRKVAEEYDVILKEDFDAKVAEEVKKEKEIDEDWARVRNLFDENEKLRNESQKLFLENQKLRDENMNLREKDPTYRHPNNPWFRIETKNYQEEKE